MLKLTLNEQKEILGGRWKLTVFGDDGTVIKVKYFRGDIKAREYAEKHYPHKVCYVDEV